MDSKTKILIGTFFKLDFRDKENKGMKKFIGIFLSYLFANTVLSLNNYLSFNKESYVILSFSAGVFLLVFIVLNDFSNLFFTKKHIEGIKYLPLNDSDIAKSKFVSAMLYLSLFSLIITIPQGVFFGLYGSGAVEILLFAIANLSSLFFISGLLIYIYTFSLRVFSSKSNFLLYFLQFVFFFYVIFISSMASKISVGKNDLLSLGFIKYFPQFYFASSLNNPGLLVILIILTLMLYSAYYFYLRKNYFKISEIIYRYEDKAGRLKNKKSFIKKYNDFICNNLIKNGEEKASYSLTANQLMNSKSMKLKFIPLVFLPVIVTILAVFTGSAAFTAAKSFREGIILLSPSISFTFIMCIRLLISATKIEDENSSGAGWIYSSLPIKSPKRIQSANIKFVYLNFGVPVLLILFLILGFNIPVTYLIFNLFYLLSASFLVNSLFLISDRAYPYSIESTKYNSASKLGEIFFIMLIGIAIFVTQIFVFENVIFVLISILMFLVISVILNKKSFALRSLK